MHLGAFDIRLRFPGAAGRYQDAGDATGLIKELGDNYGRYHRFLAERLTEFGGRPDPAAYGSDVEAFYRDSDDFAEIVIAETLLRRCRAMRRDGRRIDEQDLDGPETLDAQHRLISVETGQPSSAPLRSGTTRPRFWERPRGPHER